LQEISPEIGRTAKLVQEIAAASIEQNSGVDQINNAVQQLNQVTQQNAASSEEIATSSEELSSQAELLLETISFFKIDGVTTQRKQQPVNRQPIYAKRVPSGAQNAAGTSKPHTTSNKGININLGIKDSTNQDGDFTNF